MIFFEDVSISEYDKDSDTYYVDVTYNNTLTLDVIIRNKEQSFSVQDIHARNENRESDCTVEELARAIVLAKEAIGAIK